eukprot:10178995-Alexandrium_andersonii.AAC.1
MDRALVSAFHLHGWAPSMALTALGPVFGLRGAPRGLVEAAAAAGTIAWIRDQGWGPAQARSLQRQEWVRLRLSGLSEPPEWFSDAAKREASRGRRLL